MTSEADCPDKSNDDIQPALATLAELDAALADLHLVSSEPATKSDLSAKLSAAEKWQERQRQAWRDRHNKEARELYAARKRAEGKGEVRVYAKHNHQPQQPHEGAADYQLRMKRDRARAYRGTTSEHVVARRSLREIMTPDEKRKAKALRERERRANMTRAEKDAEAARKRQARQAKKEREQAEAETSIKARQIF